MLTGVDVFADPSVGRAASVPSESQNVTARAVGSELRPHANLVGVKHKGRKWSQRARSKRHHCSLCPQHQHPPRCPRSRVNVIVHSHSVTSHLAEHLAGWMIGGSSIHRSCSLHTSCCRTPNGSPAHRMPSDSGPHVSGVRMHWRWQNSWNLPAWRLGPALSPSSPSGHNCRVFATCHDAQCCLARRRA